MQHVIVALAKMFGDDERSRHDAPADQSNTWLENLSLFHFSSPAELCHIHHLPLTLKGFMQRSRVHSGSRPQQVAIAAATA